MITTSDLSDSADTVRKAIEGLCREQGHDLGTVSQDQSGYELSTKRTPMNWDTALALPPSPSDPEPGS